MIMILADFLFDARNFLKDVVSADHINHFLVMITERLI